MAKEIFSQSPAELAPVAIESEALVESHSTVIKILVFSNQPTLLEKAERIFHRDMSSQLIHCFRAHGVVVAYLSPLNLFNPSECLSFYHYHLDRSLQSKATIYLSTHTTKGGQL